MQRFVLEPILLAIFGELLFPMEPVEYLMPYSTVLELHELLESEQIVTDPAQNELVKQSLEQLVAFFERPFVRKKMEKILRMPWTKSTPILFSERVTFTVVFAIDNAEFGEKFDPIETELLLLARREQLPIISDQLPFQQRIVEANIPVTVLDVAEFGFFVEEYNYEETPLEDIERIDATAIEPHLRVEKSPEKLPEKHESVSLVTPTTPVFSTEQPQKKETPLYPFIIGGLALLLIISLITLLR